MRCIMDRKLVEKLLNCNISWKDINMSGNGSSYLINMNNTNIQVEKHMVINAIQSCLDNKYTMKDLIDWVNVVRFSDIFYFEDSVQDCIISILDRIEESDEFGSELTQEDLCLMIDKLQKNEEW